MPGGVCCLRRRGEWWTRLSLDLEHLGRPDESLEVSTICSWCHMYIAHHDLVYHVIILIIFIITIITITTIMVLLSASQTQSNVLKLALLSAEMLGTCAYLLSTIHSETTAKRSLKPKYHLE